MATQLILLRGNSGSGKTTLARALVAHLGADDTVLLQQDVIRRALLHASDHPGTPAVPLLAHLIANAAGWTPTVIVEGILRADVYGAMLQAVLHDFAPRAHSFYLAVPFATTLARNATKPRPFADAELRRWWRAADALPGDVCLPAAALTVTLSRVLEVCHHE